LKIFPNKICHPLVEPLGDFLCQSCHPQILCTPNAAFIRLNFSGQHLHQCRLAATVSPKQANVFAMTQVQINLVEQD
jgi:SET domain-containing protein